MANESVRRSWDRFLNEVALVRQYRGFFSLVSPIVRQPPVNPILESTLPSLLQIKAVAILDVGLHAALDAAGEKPKARGFRNDLNGRIETAYAAGILKDVALLHRVRSTRNDVAHEFDERLDWDKLESDVAVVHGALLEMGLVGERPKLEVFWERNPKKVLKDPKAVLGFDYIFAVREGDQIRAEIRWSEEILGLGK
jgi:hypothetical protein